MRGLDRRKGQAMGVPEIGLLLIVLAGIVSGIRCGYRLGPGIGGGVIGLLIGSLVAFVAFVAMIALKVALFEWVAGPIISLESKIAHKVENGAIFLRLLYRAISIVGFALCVYCVLFGVFVMWVVFPAATALITTIAVTLVLS